MIDLEKLTKIYIKKGNFNLDDVMSIAVLKALKPEVEVVRTDNDFSAHIEELPLRIKEGEYSLVYKKEALYEKNNFSSLTSMLVKDFKDELFDKFEIINKTEAYSYFKTRYVSKLYSGIRVGFHGLNGMGVNKIIERFNAQYYEILDGYLTEDDQFDLAVEFMSIHLENIMRLVKEEADYKAVEDKIWDDASKESKDGIFVLSEHIPWQKQLFRDPATTAKIIISKSNRGGYNLVAKDRNEVEIKESKFLNFLHPSHFMGVADTLDNAILAARDSLAPAPQFA